MTKGVEEIKADLRGLFLNRLGEVELGDSDPIFEIGIVSSLFALEIVVFVEFTYKMTLERSELNRANFESLDSLARMVLRQQSRNEPAGAGNDGR